MQEVSVRCVHNLPRIFCAHCSGKPMFLDPKDRSHGFHFDRPRQPEEITLITATPAQMAQLKALRVRKHMYWPACFSTNGHETWAFATYGYHHVDIRIRVDGESDLLDRIVLVYCSSVRPYGGRIFIDDDGAWCFDDSLRRKRPFAVIQAV